MKTVGNTVLAQNVGLDIPLQECNYNFSMVYWQVSLSKVASSETKYVIFSGMRCFVIKEYQCSLWSYTCVCVGFSEKFEREVSSMQIKRIVDQFEKKITG